MGDFLEKLWQFSWRRSKMDCLLKKGVPNIATFDKWQCKVHRFWNRNNFEMEMILKWKWSWNGFEFFMASSLTYFQLMLLYYTPENTIKPLVFWCFQGAQNGKLARNALIWLSFQNFVKWNFYFYLQSVCLFLPLF